MPAPRRRRDPDPFEVLSASRRRLEAALADVIRADADGKRAALITEQERRARLEREGVEVLGRALAAAQEPEHSEPEQEHEPGKRDRAAEAERVLGPLFRALGNPAED